MLKKIFKLNLDDFGIVAAIMGGAFLLLEVIINIIMVAVKPDTVPTLCGMILAIGAFMLCTFMNGYQIPVGFDQMLRFGVTRKSTLVGITSLMAGETAFAFALAWLLAQADRLIAHAWVAAQPALTIEEFSVPLWGYAAMAGATLVLGFICGAVIQFFGRKAMVVLWFGFMGFVMVMNVSGWDALDNLDQIPPLAIAAAMVVLAAACVWSVWTLLRATVKN